MKPPLPRSSPPVFPIHQHDHQLPSSKSDINTTHTTTPAHLPSLTELVHSGWDAEPDKREVQLEIITPSRDLGPALDLEQPHLKQLVALGVGDAEEWVAPR